jgi:hypothetical protein
LREAGGLDESEEVLTQAALRFPSSSEIATNHGWIANTRRDWSEAVQRWESVRARFPESHSGYAGAGAALRELGKFEEAEAVLAAGIERLPFSVDIAVTHAGIASMRRDWVEAARRWEAVRLQFPRSPSAYTGAAALKALGRLDEADVLRSPRVSNNARAVGDRSLSMPARLTTEGLGRGGAALGVGARAVSGQCCRSKWFRGSTPAVTEVTQPACSHRKTNFHQTSTAGSAPKGRAGRDIKPSSHWLGESRFGRKRSATAKVISLPRIAVARGCHRDAIPRAPVARNLLRRLPERQKHS